MTDREALPYYVLFVATITVIASLPWEQSLNLWDIALACVAAAVTIIGTIYCYTKNGGKAGYDFIQKAIVLGWVVFFRCILPLLIFTMVIYAVASLFGISAEPTSWINVLVVAILEAVYYQRLGRHLQDTSASKGSQSANSLNSETFVSPANN